MLKYDPNKPDTWSQTTDKLIKEFPLDMEYLVNTTLSCWNTILNIEIGNGLMLRELQPKPQIMGFFLHALIAYQISKDHPASWRPEKTSSDKDVVNIVNDDYSFEIKTSSDAKHIFGNRSYAQKGATSEKKSKSSYYLAINFEKFEGNSTPQIKLIRFGWLDHEDWEGQKASTGQQARLSAEVESGKLKTIYKR